DYDMVANFYRLVDNEFQLWQLQPDNLTIADWQLSITNDEFTADGQTGEREYSVTQKRAGPESDWYEVTVPLLIDENYKLYFVAWSPDGVADGNMMANSSIDESQNLVTTLVKPDLHHKTDAEGNNPYK